MRRPWFERRFGVAAPELLDSTIERLRGTPARLEERLLAIEPALRTRRVGERWSIQENAGHLLDLEGLWRGRVDDFAQGLEVLRPADVENRKTHEAAHNDADLTALLDEFPGGEERREPISTQLDDVWDTWTTLLLALGLLSAEWILRKRVELV